MYTNTISLYLWENHLIGVGVDVAFASSQKSSFSIVFFFRFALVWFSLVCYSWFGWFGFVWHNWWWHFIFHYSPDSDLTLFYFISNVFCTEHFSHFTMSSTLGCLFVSFSYFYCLQRFVLWKQSLWNLIMSVYLALVSSSSACSLVVSFIFHHHFTIASPTELSNRIYLVFRIPNISEISV